MYLYYFLCFRNFWTFLWRCLYVGICVFVRCPHKFLKCFLGYSTLAFVFFSSFFIIMYNIIQILFRVSLDLFNLCILKIIHVDCYIIRLSNHYLIFVCYMDNMTESRFNDFNFDFNLGNTFKR